MDSHRSSLRVVSRRSASEDEALLKPLLLWGFNPAYEKSRVYCRPLSRNDLQFRGMLFRYFAP